RSARDCREARLPTRVCEGNRRSTLARAADEIESRESSRSLLSNPDVSRQARVLLICDDRRGAPNTVLDHIDAFRRYSRHDIHTLNTRDMPRSIALDLDYFDVAVIHYSVVLSSLNYLSADFRAKLRRFPGLKVEFIQDDYRWIDSGTGATRDSGIDGLFTVAREPAASEVYADRHPG